MENAGFTRSDEESLRLTAISKLPRHDPDFDMAKVLADNREVLSTVRPLGSRLLVVEDLRPRNPGKVIPIKRKYFQLKGEIVAVGPDVESARLRPGAHILFGLYNGQKVSLGQGGRGLHTWFVSEKRVLGVVDPSARLSE